MIITKLEFIKIGLSFFEFIRREKSLYGLQGAAETSDASVKNLKVASLNNMGLERSLNQSIRFLDEDLETYLSITEQMVASIDRILAKSKFVVGEIDYNQEKSDDT